MYVSGADGQIELLADRVIIHRKGVLNVMKYGLNATREIPLASISGVDYRAPHFFGLGMIDFDHAGHNNVDEQKQNTVKFGKKHARDFLALKEKIFQMMQAKK